MLAWLAVLAVGAGVAAYAVVIGPDTRPVDDRPRLSMSVPKPPAPTGQAAAEGQQKAGPLAPSVADESMSATGESPEAADGGDAAASANDTAEAASPSQSTATDAPAGESGGSAAARIPQPPTRNGQAPVNLLAGEAGQDDGNGPTEPSETQQAATQTGRTESAQPATPAQDTARPQLPVSDPNAPAWKRYAQRMTPPQGMPKIAIIVRGLGLSSAAAQTATNQLPANVSLAFTPYARDRAKAWAAEARRNGHEVLVDLPMQPANYPATDPGPQAVMTGLSAQQNLQRLDWLLAQVDQEVGAVAQMGAAVLSRPQVVEPILRDLKDRGLMFVDNGVVADSAARQVAQRLGLPYAVNDRTLDGGQVSRRAIEARLVEAERIAREQGLAVVIAHPYPVSLELLVSWTDELEARGFVLVPATYAAIERAGQSAAQLR